MKLEVWEVFHEIIVWQYFNNPYITHTVQISQLREMEALRYFDPSTMSSNIHAYLLSHLIANVATLAQTTTASMTFHGSRKYEPLWSKAPISIIWRLKHWFNHRFSGVHSRLPLRIDCKRHLYKVCLGHSMKNSDISFLVKIKEKYQGKQYQYAKSVSFVHKLRPSLVNSLTVSLNDVAKFDESI